jgi:phosphoglycolate phosphatase
MRLANVLFDLDGTLVDTLPGIEYSSQVAVRAVLLNREFTGLRQRIGPPIREIFHQTFPEVAPEVLDRLERHFRASYDSEGWKKSVAHPMVSATLRQLVDWGVQCFVVTNKPAAPTGRILRHLGLWEYFKETISPDSRPVPFTSKVEAIAFLLSKHSLEIGYSAFVGDSEDDACAARTCNLPFVAVKYGYGAGVDTRCDDTKCLAILSEFSQLLSLVTGSQAAGNPNDQSLAMGGINYD